MIHIVFEEYNLAILQQAMALDTALQGTISFVRDDFAVGPLLNIFETDGFQRRRNWWQNLLKYANTETALPVVNDKLTVHQLQKALTENPAETAWIWVAQNQHDVCGYYWLVAQLAQFQGRIEILFLNNLPFINEKGAIFYPTHLHQILPKEFLKAKKLARPITASEFEVDTDEWKKLCAENAPIRILEGGKKIAGKESDFYDAALLEVITHQYQKVSKILFNALGKMNIQTGDIFLAWRLQKMADLDQLQLIGSWEKGWKDVDIKKK